MMILKKTPITKRQITIWTAGPSPLDLTPFNLPFEVFVSTVVTLSVGAPPPDSMSVGGES
jgi:hypothetical protein